MHDRRSFIMRACMVLGWPKAYSVASEKLTEKILQQSQKASNESILKLRKLSARLCALGEAQLDLELLKLYEALLQQKYKTTDFEAALKNGKLTPFGRDLIQLCLLGLEADVLEIFETKNPNPSLYTGAGLWPLLGRTPPGVPYDDDWGQALKGSLREA